MSTTRGVSCWVVCEFCQVSVVYWCRVCVHPFAILSVVVCVICSLLMNVPDASGDHILEAYSRLQRSWHTRGGTVRQQRPPANRDHLYSDSLLFMSAGFLPRVSSQRLN